MNQQKVNILAIAPYHFLPAVNGGHKAIEQLYSNLALLTNVFVVSVKSNDDSFAKNYKLVKLFSNGALHYLNVLYFGKIKHLIREHHITHVMTEHAYMGWLGILLKKYTGVTFIVRSHNIESMRFKTIGKWWWKAMWYYEKWICKRADFNFYITEEDREWAINQYHVEEEKCGVITFGTALNQPPNSATKQRAKEKLQQVHHIPSSHKLLLFNGSFSYRPNLDALHHLLNVINPILIDKAGDYTIIICGIDIPSEILQTTFSHVAMAGFVSNVSDYFMGADVFICPVTSGGGIKTKLVEALAHDDTCVSYYNSAIGIDESVCNGKLMIAEDHNTTQFVKLIQQALQTDDHIQGEFYQKYSGKSIAEYLYKTLQDTLPQ